MGVKKVDKPVNDFIVVVGEVDSDFENFKILRLSEDARKRNERWTLRTRACDVPVRRSPGSTLLHWIRGEPTISGKVDVDKDREGSVSESLIFNIKEGGKPSVFLAFPDSFRRLPKSLKEHPYLSVALQMMYEAMHSSQAQLNMLEEAGAQRTEALDILAQSQTKMSEFIMNQFRAYNQNLLNETKMQTEKKKEDVGKEPMY